MNRLHLLRISSVLFALTACNHSLQAATLTAATSPISLTCTQGQTCSSSGTSDLSISAGTGYYTVTPPSVPWLVITPMAGTADVTPADNVLTFSVSAGWTTLGPGFYSTSVAIASLGNTGTSVTVTLEIQSAAPTLVVKGGPNTLNPIAFLAGAAAPTMSLTVLSSSGLPLPFTVTAASATTPEGVSSWLTSVSSSGIAYSWGTTLSFTASATATTQDAQPGDLLTATITITPSGQNPVIIPVSIAVSAAAATITGVSPSAVPLLVTGVAPGFVTLTLHGTNFVSTTGTQKTKVFIGATAATATQVVTDYVTVLSPNYLTVTVPYASTGAPFAVAGASALQIGVANGTNPTAPLTGDVPLTVTAAPIIYAVTSASAYVNVSPPKAAPYDILSIFGANFCALCTGTNNVLVGAPDPVYGRFPTFLSPDSGTHKISVVFSLPGTASTNLPGYILFASSNQINVLVPGTLTTVTLSGAMNVAVGYDLTNPAGAAATSALFSLSTAATDPGIFTIESDGQGQGAITDGVTFVLNSSTNPAEVYSSSTPTLGTVAIFMTGLGAPTSAGSDLLTTNPTYFSNCISGLGSVVGSASVVATGYLGTVNTPHLATAFTGAYNPPSTYVVPSPLWTSIDGAVLEPALLQGNYPPCFPIASSGPTVPIVTIGGTPATVTYAGFVSGSIAGLYQINAQVNAPGTSLGTPPNAYPVTVSQNSVVSQAGVTMWVDF
jgi:uncharacterized protein (TIGR03437 family)